MNVISSIQREYETYGLADGDLCVFSKYPVNHNFARSHNLRTKRILENDLYCAFPYFTKVGGRLVGIFSEGDQHAKSDRQIMARSDDGGLSWSLVTFFENSTDQYDFSLIDDLLLEDERVTLKVWTVRKVNGVVSATPFGQIGGYNIWGEVIEFGDSLLRTGYANNTVALLESLDQGESWHVKSVMAAVSGKEFNEASLTSFGGTALISLIREDSSSKNLIYKVVSHDGGVTWSEPVQIPNVFGSQPKVTKMQNGDCIVTTGDRVGTSGVSSLKSSYFSDKTGISLWRSTDNLATFGTEFNLAGMHSTDGGQPWAVEVSPNRVFIPYYARRDITCNAGIFSVQLDIESL